MRLLSPQHWAATATSNESNRNRDKVRSIQLWNRNILQWGSRSQYTKTIYNNKRSRVPIMYSAPGTVRYNAYQAAVRAGTDQSFMTCFASNVVSDSEDEVANTEGQVRMPRNKPIEVPKDSVTVATDQHPSELPKDTPSITPTQAPAELPSEVPIQVEEVNDMFIDLEPRNTEEFKEETELLQATTDRGELMRWHYRLGHLSFKKLKIMAKLHLIPSRLEHVRPPKCSGCIYGKMH